MTQFAVGEPVVTNYPVITVDACLPVGTHRFQLQVATFEGRKSVPVVIVVTVSASAASASVSKPQLHQG